VASHGRENHLVRAEQEPIAFPFVLLALAIVRKNGSSSPYGLSNRKVFRCWIKWEIGAERVNVYRDADKALYRDAIESFLGDIADSLLYGHFVFDAIMRLY
jgi:hypothetical protein